MPAILKDFATNYITSIHKKDLVSFAISLNLGLLYNYLYINDYFTKNGCLNFLKHGVNHFSYIIISTTPTSYPRYNPGVILNKSVEYYFSSPKKDDKDAKLNDTNPCTFMANKAVIISTKYFLKSVAKFAIDGQIKKIPLFDDPAVKFMFNFFIMSEVYGGLSRCGTKIYKNTLELFIVDKLKKVENHFKQHPPQNFDINNNTL